MRKLLKVRFKLFFALIVFYVFSATVYAQEIDWLPLEKAQQLALKNDKKVLIYAKASWCGYCKRMEEEVFTQQSVADSLRKYFYTVRIDIESDNKLIFSEQRYTEQGLSRKFRIFSTPTFIFLNSDGSVIGRQPGYMPADVFTKIVSFTGSDAYRNQEFEEYLK